MDIDLREPVQLGDSTQWIRIRAANARNPLLLLVQMGPGLPMISEVPAFHRALSLEDDFTVVYWDQRGSGKSFDSKIPRSSMTVEQFIADLDELVDGELELAVLHRHHRRRRVLRSNTVAASENTWKPTMSASRLARPAATSFVSPMA